MNIISGCPPPPVGDDPKINMGYDRIMTQNSESYLNNKTAKKLLEHMKRTNMKPQVTKMKISVLYSEL